jgi:hypothetical protein
LKDISGIDGVDQWSSVIHDLQSKRNSFIYNVDPFGTYGCNMVPTEAIRYLCFLMKKNIFLKLLTLDTKIGN